MNLNTLYLCLCKTIRYRRLTKRTSLQPKYAPMQKKNPAGFNSIIGAQIISGLWRIYPRDKGGLWRIYPRDKGGLWRIYPRDKGGLWRIYPRDKGGLWRIYPRDKGGLWRIYPRDKGGLWRIYPRDKGGLWRIYPRDKGGLWRIYPRDKGGRQKLVLQGMTGRGVQVTVKDKNPYLVRSLDAKEEETPATKVIVGNVPISFSDQILKSVHELGCTLRSKLILERDRSKLILDRDRSKLILDRDRSKLILDRDRDEKGKLTHWLTGRRINYVSVPRDPLPKLIQVGPFKASVYHREQKRTFCAKRLLTAEIAYRKGNTRRSQRSQVPAMLCWRTQSRRQRLLAYSRSEQRYRRRRLHRLLHPDQEPPEPERQTSSKQAKQDPHHRLHNQTAQEERRRIGQSTDAPSSKRPQPTTPEPRQLHPWRLAETPPVTHRGHSSDRQTSTSPRGGRADGWRGQCQWGTVFELHVSFMCLQVWYDDGPCFLDFGRETWTTITVWKFLVWVTFFGHSERQRAKTKHETPSNVPLF